MKTLKSPTPPNEDFDIGFMFFLHRCGYLQDNLFTPEFKWKKDKYMDEYLKVYSYENRK